MNKITSKILQTLTVLIALAVFIFMLWEPQAEGVNVGKTLTQIYLHDPFVAWAYACSIAFFVGAYNLLRVWGYAGDGELRSRAGLKALNILKLCAFLTASLIVVTVLYLGIKNRGQDDIAGVAMLGLITTILSLSVGTIAGKVEKRLRS